MAKTRPAPSRLTITDAPEGLRIVIPGRRSLFVIGFLGFWICGWAVGEVMGLTQFLKGATPSGQESVMFTWFAIWTVGGALAIYAWVWQVIGKEIVTLHGQTFRIRRDMGGFGFDKEYHLLQMNDLRVGPAGFDPMDISSALQLWGIGGGVIAFEFGGKTCRFGAGLDEAEAKQVADSIQRRCRISERTPAGGHR